MSEEGSARAAVPIEDGSAWAADPTEVRRKVGKPELTPQSATCQNSTLEGEPLWECAKSALLGLDGTSLVVFDWDDTLLPSSALAAAGHLDTTTRLALERNAEGALCWTEPPLPAEELAAIASAALKALQVAKKVGSRLIVTNANHGWVHEAAAKFLPSLAQELKDIPVISARSIFEPQGILDSKQWKVMCFRRIVQCFHSGAAGIFGVQSFISIGDSVDEQQAAMKVAQCCPCYVKAVKLLERPTMTHVVQQLELCSSHLAKITSYPGNVDVDLGMMVAIEGEGILQELNTSGQWNVFSNTTTSSMLGDEEPLEKRRRLLPWAGALGA